MRLALVDEALDKLFELWTSQDESTKNISKYIIFFMFYSVLAGRMVLKVDMDGKYKMFRGKGKIGLIKPRCRKKVYKSDKPKEIYLQDN